MQLLLTVAEARSVTAAARRLRITQPTASRRLSQLESFFGERLFVRSVEGVIPTPFGERMLVPARRMAEWAGEVDRAAAAGAQRSPGGVVRITASPAIAFEFLAPFAAWLRGVLPDVRLEVASSVSYVDLVRREADLALRMAPASSKELVTLATLHHTVAPFGSPAYAKSLPKAPRLADVAWIAWAPPLEHISPNPELAKVIPGFCPAFASDDFLVQLRAAEAGVGAIFLGRTRHRFSEDALVELDIDVGELRGSLHLVCAKTALDIPRVRTVADLLVAELRHAREPLRGQRSAARRKLGPSR